VSAIFAFTNDSLRVEQTPYHRIIPHVKPDHADADRSFNAYGLGYETPAAAYGGKLAGDYNVGPKEFSN
jgi:hypothetical protein